MTHNTNHRAGHPLRASTRQINTWNDVRARAAWRAAALRALLAGLAAGVIVCAVLAWLAVRWLFGAELAQALAALAAFAALAGCAGFLIVAAIRRARQLED